MSRKEKPASEMTEAGVKSSSQEMIFIIQLPNLGSIDGLLSSFGAKPYEFVSSLFYFPIP